MTDGYRALRDSAAWLALDTRGRLLARGRDRVRFLHNITSNEVKKMAPGVIFLTSLLVMLCSRRTRSRPRTVIRPRAERSSHAAPPRNAS